jgi:hypothetical protein
MYPTVLSTIIWWCFFLFPSFFVIKTFGSW